MAQVQSTATAAKRGRQHATSQAKGAERPAEGRSFASGSTPTTQRSEVGPKVRKLLMDPKLTYEQIAERVKKQVPGAQTSARSVASVAHGLRVAGVEVPERARSAATH